jgi:predicted small lipoprotein YifL
MPGKFTQSNGPLSVTIAARGRYGYLYFPDDGTNTKRHAGNQQFMMRGAENATAQIVDLCIGKLTENFN